jgi:LysR family nitrogen assimilation transcriptional regulator
MICESIFREDLVLAYTQACRPVPPPTVKVTELDRYPLVLPSTPNTIRALVDSTCNDLNVRLNIVAEVDVVQTIVETTSYGNMFTIIPRSAISDIPGQAELAYSAITDPPIKNNLTLALPTNRPHSTLVSATVDIIRKLDIARYLA